MSPGDTCTHDSCALISTAFIEDFLKTEALSLKGNLPQATVCLGNVPLVALKIIRSAVIIADERDHLEICWAPSSQWQPSKQFCLVVWKCMSEHTLLRYSNCQTFAQSCAQTMSWHGVQFRPLAAVKTFAEHRNISHTSTMFTDEPCQYQNPVEQGQKTTLVAGR
jgi:hypothetical protein